MTQNNEDFFIFFYWIISNIDGDIFVIYTFNISLVLDGFCLGIVGGLNGFV
jgi:hypothetical protein